MSIYQSTCERFICSPVASALTAILSAAYFITYPSFSSLFLSAAVVRCVDLLQKRLLKYDLERFKSFPRTVVDEAEQEEEETHEQVEQPDVPEDETQEQVEQPDEANDESEEDEEYIPSHKPNLKRRTYNLRNRSD
jgi:hypothetical protein